MTKLAALIVASLTFSGTAHVGPVPPAMSTKHAHLCSRMIGVGYRGFIMTICASTSAHVGHDSHGS